MLFSEEASYQNADLAWGQLTSSAYRASGSSNADARLQDFMKEVEFEHDRFRRLGEEFWSNYPEDPRRYRWLALTANFAPAYPLDMDAWAEQEAQIGVNSSAIDVSRHAAWERRYGEMREEFWSSPSVDDELRMLLWSGELRQAAFGIRRARVRGENLDSDSELLLRHIVEFSKWLLPRIKRATASDVKTQYAWHYSRATEPALAWRDVLDVEADRLVSVANQFVHLEREASVWSPIAGRIIDSGGYPSVGSWQIDAQSKLFREAVTYTNKWEYLGKDPAGDQLYYAILAASYDFIHIGQPNRNYGMPVFMSEDEVSRRKFRHFGLEHFDRLERHRLTWISWTAEQHPGLYGRYMDLIFSSWADRVKLPIDWDERHIEAAKLSDAVERFSADPKVRASDVLFAQMRLLWIEMWRARESWSQQKDAERIEQFLNDVVSLVESHGRLPDDPGKQEDQSPAVWNGLRLISSLIIRDKSQYGLSDSDIYFFAQKLLRSDNQSIRETAAAALNPVVLEPGVQVALEAPTLDGETLVDTSSLRGDIVLIDHWDTNCAPCIAAFPGLHEVYLEYKARGFEVLSIAYDGASSRRAVDRIKDRFGLTWTTLNGEGLWEAVSAKFGYPGYPQYMLLDRKGRWVAGTDEMGNGANLRMLLDELLAEEANGFYDRQPPLWKVSDEDTTVYLYGTLEGVKNGFDWWTGEAAAALRGSEVLYYDGAVETFDDNSDRISASYRLNPTGTSLSDYLTDVQEADVRASADAAGISWEEIEDLRPAFASIELNAARLETDGLKQRQGIAAVIMAEARKADVESRPLVTPERRMRYAASISDEGQVAWLMHNLDVGNSDGFDRLFQAWYWGDTDTIEAEVVSGERKAISEAYEALVIAPNSEWAGELSRVIEEEAGTVFVAVDVRHLVGPDSLQIMLAKKGYVSTRIQ